MKFNLDKVAGIVKTTNLKHLTIPRLQELLKTVRARYQKAIYCDLCDDWHKCDEKAAKPLKDRYEAVKAELKRRQS